MNEHTEAMLDQAALYAVDALTDDERAEFEAHLSDCATCQREVMELRELAADLSTAVSADPPESLRTSVLAAVAAEPRNVSTIRVAPESMPAAASREPVEEPPSDARGKVVPLGSARRSSRIPAIIAAAAVTLALVCGGWALVSRHDAQQSQSAQNRLTGLLAAKDVRTITGTVSGTSATLVVSRTQDKALLVTGTLPALPDGKVYELWTINKTPVPAGTFNPSSGTNVWSLPDTALTSAVVAMTVEPAGGSQQPTSKPILALNVPSAG